MGRIQDQQRHVQQVSDLHLATIEALALAIDAKDQTAQSHIRRVQVYAAGLAQALGMSGQRDSGRQDRGAAPRHRQARRARAHPVEAGTADAGRVPEDPHPPAGRRRDHQRRAVPLSGGAAHPEPSRALGRQGLSLAGLKGEEIPLGARILSVVDYFDALMSERPYHKAMSLDAAIGLLRQESTKALDPRVVQTFIDIYPTLAAEADASAEPSRKLTRVPTHAPTAAPAVGLVDESSPARTSIFQDIALAHREIYALYEIAQAMGSSLGVSDTMALISSKLSNIVPFSCCALFLYDDEAETLRCRFATGVEAETIQQLTIRSGHGLTGWVARNRRPLVNARPSTDFEAAGFPSDRTSLHSALVCPLLFNERFIGTISVYHTEPSVYTDDHRRLLDRISEQAAAVIYNSIVFEQTQEDSLTDPLTGLPNTRFMFMHLTRELARAERLKSEVSLLVMDLDNFKEINDTYGHHVGDRALREVAGVLRAAIRPYDICVRYAGDEFIVVLSGCGAEEAERKRLELQRAVDELQFEPRPGQDAAARDQHRRGDLPARRRLVRDAARDGRQPHVPRQDAAQAPRLDGQPLTRFGSEATATGLSDVDERARRRRSGRLRALAVGSLVRPGSCPSPRHRPRRSDHPCFQITDASGRPQISEKRYRRPPNRAGPRSVPSRSARGRSRRGPGSGLPPTTRRSGR